MILTFAKKVLVLILCVSAQNSMPYSSTNQQVPAGNQSSTQNEIVTNKLHIGSDVPLFTVPNSAVDVPIPINIPLYAGNESYTSYCNRDEIMVGYGNMCQKVLKKGNCKIDEEVILDPITRMGICVPRLCSPDRIFVVATQLCHDPQDTNVCPGKRELRYTAFGTAICDCPDGTIENSNSTTMYGEACKSIFGDNSTCSNGQVFYSVDFQGSPQCLPDPCIKFNMHRKPDTLQYVPDEKTGYCHQLGSTYGVCPEGTIYALHLTTLKGVCETLENLGFDVFSPEEVATLKNLYGPTTVWDDVVVEPSVGYNAPSTATVNGFQLFSDSSMAPSSDKGNDLSGYTSHYRFQTPLGRSSPVNTVSMNNFMKGIESKILHSLGLRYRTEVGILELMDSVLLSRNEFNQVYSNARRKPRALNNEPDPYFQAKYKILRISREGTNVFSKTEVFKNTFAKTNLQRFKRQGVILFAVPSNVFETKLLSCTPGTKRDFNNKCQETILPIRMARSIRSKPLSPIPPRPMCPPGQRYNIRRLCTSDASFLSKSVIGGLG